jgi:geranylgeranyl reductase family protein
MSHFDVLIVGGGPAGSSAAWHCAQAGLEVCVLDRAAFPRAKPCAEYVSPEGSRILHAMGALDTLETQAAQLNGMVVHAPSGGRIHGEFVARHGFRGFRDRGLGIRREVLDTVLLDCARAAGVQVMERAKVDALTVDRAGTVTGVKTNGHTINARLVIGADGLRSVVSRRLGLARQSRVMRRVALVAHFRDVRDVGTLGEMHVTRNGYVGLARVNEGLVNVALVVPARASVSMRGDAAGYLDAWLRAHPQLAPRFAGATRETPVRATGPFASRATRPWAPGVMLTGDAADFFDPFTGEGIYSALRGGDLLAPFAHEAVQAASRTRQLDAFRGYEQARVRQFGGKWRVEKLVGLAVAFPPVLDYAAHVLSRDRDLADLLIGVTGDFVPPSAILRPGTLLRLLGLAPGHRSPSNIS